MSGAVWIAIWLLLGALTLELLAPNRVREGFQALQQAPEPATDKPNLISNMIPRRGDVSVGKETGGYVQDLRYFAGYADVQRYGFKNDFCRVLKRSGADDEEEFFACALAGTKTASSFGFRTKSRKDGLQLSRDDYMRDIMRDGRQAYCRILQMPDGRFLPMCLRAMDKGFADTDQMDPEPPEETKLLLDFYGGCQLWLRLKDDMVDYINRAVVTLAGDLRIDETPKQIVTNGLHFNGRDQFMRFGDTDELSLGNKVNLRTNRAFSVWVKFDEFTNNAHIFDFGDGPGLNNTFLGILGKGDAGGGKAGSLRPGPACQETTVPVAPSGAQFCPELKPQELLEDDPNVNVDEYTCPGIQVMPRKLPPIQTKPVGGPPKNPEAATLLYEVWDKKLRKMQIKLNRAIGIEEWTHIVITAASMDAMRPDIQVWVNGELLYTQEQGYLPQPKVTSNNYLGKSNWVNDFSEYELRDELFKGSIFDFRMYGSFLGPGKIKRIYEWGQRQLGIVLPPIKGVEAP